MYSKSLCNCVLRMQSQSCTKNHSNIQQTICLGCISISLSKHSTLFFFSVQKIKNVNYDKRNGPAVSNLLLLKGNRYCFSFLLFPSPWFVMQYKDINTRGMMFTVNYLSKHSTSSTKLSSSSIQK